MKLVNNIEIPAIGYGTWQTPNDQTTVLGVTKAIEAGYRHINTAAVYGNETAIGRALKQSSVDRESLFVASKVWNTERGYEKTKKAFRKTLQDLQLDYLDLYLIHWPAAGHQFRNWQELNLYTWRALEELCSEGLVKSIGVSNFLPHHLQPLIDAAEIKPMVNQIEYHPGFRQQQTVDFCRINDIIVEGWSPLGTGRLLENQSLQDIATKYNKTVAQLCIRWASQNEVIPLPKSITPNRIIENFEVWGFEIDKADMQTIDKMKDIGSSGLDPDKVNF